MTIEMEEKVRECSDYLMNVRYGILFNWRNMTGEIPPTGEIVPMIDNFFDKAIQDVESWITKGEDMPILRSALGDLLFLVEQVSRNTREGQQLSDEQVMALKKIFEEVDLLYDEMLDNAFYRDIERENDSLGCKISVIIELFFHNIKRDRLTNVANVREPDWIFKDYENLWKIVHRVNTEWQDLIARGIGSGIFKNFCNCFRNENDFLEATKLNEKERLEILEQILDGEFKFIPVYKWQFLGYGLLKKDSDLDQIFIPLTEEDKKEVCGLLPKN